MGVTLFHQPDSGETDWTPDHLLGALEEAGIKAKYQSTDEEGWKEAFSRTHELAIAAGGDGTAARVAIAIPDRSVPLAILPLGSANNIARSLGYDDSDLDAIIRGLVGEPDETAIRVGDAKGHWGIRKFVESIGLGALARSTAGLQDDKLDGDQKRQAGRDAFRDRVATIEPLRVSVHVDGEPLGERALLLELMNIPMIGPNLRIGPDVDTADPHVAAVYLPESGREAMLDWLSDPDVKGAPPLRTIHGTTVDLDAHDEALRIDDKTVEWDGHHLRIRLEPVPVRVLRPGRAAR